jgi:Sulfotransferase domain
MVTPVKIGRRRLGRVRRSGEHALRQASAGRRPLPDFLIIGAQKAGTTSLHDYLCQHSSVTSPVTKEVHYFDNEFSRGSGWYRAHFPRERGYKTVTGESTPYYLFHPLAPRRVAATLPGVRLIVVLRDPIDRAHSHHNHERALGFEELEFEAALAAEGERLAGQEQLLSAGGLRRSWAHQHQSYLRRGLYAEQLGRWLVQFDRERLLVLSAEDLFADPLSVVLEAQEFLGLPAEEPVDISARNARSYAPIADDLRRRLGEVFEPRNRELERLLGRDFGWG